MDKTINLWDKLKQEGEDHYKNGKVEPIDLFKAGLKEEKMASFETGATRTDSKDKLDYEGFLSPCVLKHYAEYMHRCRHLPDGTMRESDNWQKGIPLDSYMKSMFRHFIDAWTCHRDMGTDIAFSDALCGVIFNAMGYLHELIKRREDI